MPPCYEKRVKLASVAREELLRAARIPEPEAAQHLITATQAEVEAGFLKGPFSTEDEVTAYLGTNQWLAVRRFVIKQSEKYRPMNDGHESGLSSAYSQSIRLRLHDSDYFTAMSLKISSEAHARRDFFSWQGTCLDLSQAYKQLRISERISTVNASGQVSFYVSCALMFGASASVFAFNRISRALHFLFTKMLHAPCTRFYDDYPMLSPAAVAKDTDTACARLLDLLGFRFARTGKGNKGLPFSEKFAILGMEADLSRLRQGTETLSNKTGRVQKLVDRFGEIGCKGSKTRHEGQVLPGLLRFSSSFYAGVTLKHICVDLNRLVHGSATPNSTALGALCRRALQALKETP